MDIVERIGVPLDPADVPEVTFWRMEPVEMATVLEAGEYVFTRGPESTRLTLDEPTAILDLANALRAAASPRPFGTPAAVERRFEGITYRLHLAGAS